MKILAMFFLTVAVLAASADVTPVPETPFSFAGPTWTEKAEGVDSTYINDQNQPWQLASFEVSQPADTTNTFTITVYRYFDYAETIVGDVTVTNAFGVVETRTDTTVTGRSWKTMQNEVFTVTQNGQYGVYSPDTSTVLPSGIYIRGDDTIVVTHDSPDPVEIISLEGFDDDTDGIYAKADDNVNDKPAFEKGDYSIEWDGSSKWEIKDDGAAVYDAAESEDTPDTVVQWKVVDGGADSDGDAITHVGENVYFRINGSK